MEGSYHPLGDTIPKLVLLTMKITPNSGVDRKRRASSARDAFHAFEEVDNIKRDYSDIFGLQEGLLARSPCLKS